MRTAPFIVAEIGGNHRGDLHTARRLIEAAKKAGADAVKFQTFDPKQMADPGVIIEAGPWAGHALLDLYWETHTPRDWHKPLFDHAMKLGLIPFSSVFHPDDVDFLETLDCSMYKIASFELTDTALIDHVAKTGKPIIMSTGMATEADIVAAGMAAFGQKTTDVTLLKCTSAYPAPASEMNLATISHLQEWLKISINHHYTKGLQGSVGLSDHTIGNTCAVVATALGATVIEKHLTLSRADGGPDAAFSAEPHEFAELVKNCRKAAQAIGTVQYGPTPAEAPQTLLRRSLGGKRGTK